MKRSDQGHAVWSAPWAGLLLTPAIVIATELARGFIVPLPTPFPFLLLGVAYATFVGGIHQGLGASGVALAYGMYFYSLPGSLFQYDARGFVHLLGAAVAFPAMVLMIGVQRRRAQRVVAVEREKAMLHAQAAERQRIMADLEEREGQARREFAELKLLYDSTPVGLALLDPDLRYLRINERLAAFNGVPVEQHLGRTLQEVLPDVASSVEPVLRQIMATRRPVIGHEVRGTTAAEPGRRRAWTVSYFPVMEGEKLLGVSLVVEEITQRKAAEEALERWRTEHQTIFDSVPAMVWFKDRDNRILRANRMAAESIGRTVAEVEGRRTEDLYPLEAAKYRRDDHEVIESGRPKLGIVELYEVPSGEPRWIRTDKIPYRDAEGNILGVIVFSVDITEQKRAEAAVERARRELELRVQDRTAELSRVNQTLQESQQRLQSILDYTTAVIYWKDPEGRYVFVNRRFEELFSLSQEAVIGYTDHDRFPAAAEALRANDRLVQEAGQVMEFEEVVPHNDGPHTYISVKFPIYGADRKLQGVCGISTDITDRKRAEAALQASEARFRTVTESISAAALIYEGTKLLYVNPAAERMTGRSRGELVGQDASVVVHPADLEVVRQRAAARQRGEEVRPNAEYRIVHASGQIRWVDYTAFNIEYDGKPAVLGTAHDITDRKRVEEELRTRLLHEEALAGCSRTLLAETATEQALRETLRYLLNASGASRVYIFENFDDPVDGLCARQTHEVCAEGVRSEVDNPILQHIPYMVFVPNWRESVNLGRFIAGAVDAFAQPLRSLLEAQGVLSLLVLPIWSGGRWYGFIGFDETKSKREWSLDEIRLLRTAAEMTGAYLERERVEAELRRARDASEAASRAKSRFLANISHEIRTPIMALLGAAELLRGGDRETGGAVDCGDVILRNGRHLLALIDDLLDQSRVDAGQLEVRVGDCSLVEILGDVRALARPFCLRTQVDFELVCESELPARLRTDRTRLTQALINLVHNALKFTAQGQVRVRVRADREAAEPMLTLAVEDTGGGIRASDLQRIFEPFTQIGPVSVGASQGVGLGLALAKSIVERLGGTLAVESTVGEGSVFRVTVPVGCPGDDSWLSPAQLADALEAASARGAPEKAQASTADGGPRPAAGAGAEHSPGRSVGRLRGTVLLAEDAADARDLMSLALSRAGAEVVSVGEGRGAVEEAARHDFDLILLDIRMPVMDGLSAAREIRASGVRAPIIALTASTTSAEQERLLAAGFDDTWPKPISLEQLVENAGAYLHSAGGAVSAAGTSASQAVLRESIESRMAAAVADFASSLPGRLRALRVALGADDQAAVRSLLHQLVGTSGVHGFMDVSDLAAKLSVLAREGRLTSSCEEFQALEALVTTIAAATSGLSSGSRSAEVSDGPAGPS